MSDHTESPPGLIASLRAMLSNALSLLATRGELAALELGETRDRALRWAALGVVAAVLLLAALVTLSFWVAAVFWDGPRALALGILTAVYALAAVVTARVVRREIADAPPLLEQTRAELKKDRDVLRGRRDDTPDANG
jgi:uncharacterized membrane protein YqjE